LKKVNAMMEKITTDTVMITSSKVMNIDYICEERYLKPFFIEVVA